MDSLQELGTLEYDRRSYARGWDGLDILRMWIQKETQCQTDLLGNEITNSITGTRWFTIIANDH